MMETAAGMSQSLASARSQSDLYEHDFFKWTVTQAQELRRTRPHGLDWENMAEEIEGLGRSDRRSIESNLSVVLLHLLKWSRQPRKTKIRMEVDDR